MADVTGRLHHAHGDRTYTLHLTARGIAKAQGIHGPDLKGLLSGGTTIPDFGICLDLISFALQKGEGLDAAEADDLADELFTADQGLPQKLFQAFMPPAEASDAPGNGKARRGR